MRRVVPCIGVLLFLLAVADSAFAQQRLFVKMESPGQVTEIVELDSRLSSLGTVLHRVRVPDLPVNSRLVTFGGGRSLAWAMVDGIGFLDTFTGAVRRFTIPDFVLGDVIGTDGNARLIVSAVQGKRLGALVADTRAGHAHFVELGPWERVVYASESHVLFVARPIVIEFGKDIPRLVDVIDASTGARIKTLDVSPFPPFKLLTNPSGTRLFVGDGAGMFTFDVISGALLASNRSDQALKDVPSSTTTFDDLRNRLIVSVRPGVEDYEDSIGISAFFADSLRFIGRARVPELPLPSVDAESFAGLTQEIDVSGLSATIFALQAVRVGHGKYYTEYTCHESQLIALHADTGAIRRTVRTTATLGPGACYGDLIRITEPAPPSVPTANVSGHHVTLNWHAPFGATRYEVEAGSAPGLADITTIRVNDPQLVVDNTPTGTYYVRVRAINTIGKSGASQDVKVVVP